MKLTLVKFTLTREYIVTSPEDWPNDPARLAKCVEHELLAFQRMKDPENFRKAIRQSKLKAEVIKEIDVP
jgi:hypothetical protein